VGTVVLHVHERLRIGDPLRPVGAEGEPRPRGDAAVTLLPGSEEIDGEKPVVVNGDLGTRVDDDGRGDEPPDVDRDMGSILNGRAWP